MTPFERRLGDVESLVGALEDLPEGEVRATALDAVTQLLDLHREVLERLLEVLGEHGDEGRRLMGALGRDPMVGGLLVLHDVHPLSLEDRVVDGLERVRPYLGSHGGGVELLGVEGGAVRLRLRGTCDGCASSRVTLEHAIEGAIREAAPDVTAIEVEGLERPPADGFVPLAQLGRAPADWVPVAGLQAPEDGRVLVRDVGGRRLVFCGLGGDWYAYGDRCPGCGRSFASSALEAGLLPCTGCGLRFDVRLAGRGVAGGAGGVALHLEPLPLLREGGEVRVAAGTGGGA